MMMVMVMLVIMILLCSIYWVLYARHCIRHVGALPPLTLKTNSLLFPFVNEEVGTERLNYIPTVTSQRVSLSRFE